MRWFNFDIDKLISWCLPTFLRDIVTIYWLRALLKPVKDLKEETLYKMQHDCRKIYLEKMLNEKFNVVGYDPNDHINSRHIFISNGFRPELLYIYQDWEELPVYLFTDEEDEEITYMDTEDEYNEQYADYIVNVPMPFDYDVEVMKSELDYYNMAGKEYQIKEI